ADEALLAQGFDDFAVKSLLAAYNGSADHHARAFGVRHQRVDDLRSAGRADGPAAVARLSVRAAHDLPTRGPTAARVEQSQIVVNFRRRGDRRARIVARRSLLNGDGWRQAFDAFDVGLLKLI